jgi:type VI secretion system protein VasD
MIFGAGSDLRMRWFAVAALACGLGGCAAPPPPPPPPTLVNITLSAATDANQNEQGVGSPVQVRVYQLSSAANFNNAEFFPLYRQDATTLGADIVKREDFELSPGKTVTDKLSPDAPVKAVGFFAAYRDYQTAIWRASAEVPAHKTTNILVTIGATGIVVKAEVLTPPPPKPAS